MADNKFGMVGRPRPPIDLAQLQQIAHAENWASLMWAEYKSRFQPIEAALAVFREVGIQLAAQAKAISDGHATAEKLAALQNAWHNQVRAVEALYTPPVRVKTE